MVHPRFSPRNFREVGAILARKHPEDLRRVAEYLVRGRGADAAQAFKEAHGASYKRNVRTCTPVDAAEQLRKLQAKWQAVSDKDVQEGRRPLFQ